MIVGRPAPIDFRRIRIRSLFWEEVEVDWNLVRAVIRNVPKVHSSRDRLIGEVLSDPSNSFVVFDQQTRIDANIRFSNNGDVLFESTWSKSRDRGALWENESRRSERSWETSEFYGGL